MKEVENQYNLWPYPTPIDDMDKRIENGYRDDASPNEFWHVFFPEKTFNDKLKIFIGGCGTNQAIWFALTYPNSEITAIDLSEASLKHNKKMIDKFNIKNLRIEKKDIFDISFDNEFDFVVSSGVIHHTKDPKKALRKLIKAGNEKSAIYIMIYSEYARVGLYYLQDIFRYFNLQPNIEDLNYMLGLINGLPKEHYAQVFMGNNPGNYNFSHFGDEAGFVDSFLHPQDISYTCLDVENLINDSGGYFQCWLNNERYYPHFLRNIPEKLSIDQLSQFEMGDFTQKILSNSAKHDFIIRKSENFKNIWHNKGDISCELFIEKRLDTINIEEFDDKSQKWGKVRKNIYTFDFDYLEGIIWKNLSKKIHINELFNVIKTKNSKNLDKDFNENNLKTTIHNLWKKGIIVISRV